MRKIKKFEVKIVVYNDGSIRNDVIISKLYKQIPFIEIIGILETVKHELFIDKIKRDDKN